MGKVAIGIPCYNGREKLGRLLDSIAMQNFRDFEVILTDDSEDGGMKDFVNQFPEIKIRYHWNRDRLGVAGNTNQALKLADNTDADYIKIMYYDDRFSSDDSLGKMVRALEKDNDAEMVFTNTREIGDGINYERNILDGQLRQVKEDRFCLISSNIIGAPSTTLVRKNCVRMDEKLTWFVDVDWYIRILERSRDFVFIDEPLITIGRSDTQVSFACKNDPARILGECIYLYKKYPELHCESYWEFLSGQAEKVINQCNVYRICRDGTVVSIYGAGEIGKRCAEFLRGNGIPYEVFIVSDGQRHDAVLDGHCVMEFGEYLKMGKGEKSAVILALNEKNRQEVIGKVEAAKVNYVVWQ